MIRRILSAIALLVLLLSIPATRLGSRIQYREKFDLSCTGCNVVLLNIDLLRADFLGLLNKKKGSTPNIDLFFKNAIVFEDVSSSSGVTAISNAATLTARHGDFTYGLLQRTYVDKPPQMPHMFRDLYSKIPTILETFHAVGYETININHGWYSGKQMLLDRGVDFYWGSGEVGATDNNPARVINKTAEVIKDRSDSSSPFILLMRSEDMRGLPYRYPVNRPHLEDPRVKYRRRAEENYDIYFQPLIDGTLSKDHPSSAKVGWMSDTQIEEYRQLSYALYRQQLKFVDEKLGRLFEVIEKSALLENTIVILYSNHGDGLYDNRVPNHGVSYQSCVSVPLIIRHPKIKLPVRVRESIALIDLGPTIHEMLSIKSTKKLDGISVVNIIRGIEAYPNKYLYGSDKESKYIRRGRYKLIVWANRSKELYDLKEDPGERNNLARQRPSLVRELYKYLVLHEVEQLQRVLSLLRSERLSTDRIE